MLDWFFSIRQDYDDSQDENSEHMRQQFLNLQAAQRGINKKSEVQPVQPPLSGQQIEQALTELKQGFYRPVMNNVDGEQENQ